MKNIIAFFLLLGMSVFNISAQSTVVSGAWKLDAGEDTHHLFFQDGFCFYTLQHGQNFSMSQGGLYEVSGGNIKVKILFNSSDSTKVGEMMVLPFSLSGNQLSLQVENDHATFYRVDNGKSPLAGVWRITGRMGADGKLADLHLTGSRQTYKMLTGTKFQWVAIDPDKKQFFGTGGGSYTFKDGKYVESIEFFSRDNSRVGANLTFDGKLENGSWHHSGLSSKGDKIHEVWNKVN
ncbi:hypothetical protein ACXZ1K_14315 [Pedobacter sp. PWIIR3]